jgi:hypothetical protein
VATTRRLGQGGDGMARLAQGDRGARRQPGRRASNGEPTGRQRPATIASLAPVTGARKALTGGARLPGRERSRGRGVRADGWGRADSGRATREGEGGRQLTGGGGMSVAGAGARRWAAWATEGRGVRACAQERGGLGRKRPSRRGVSFSFFIFYFLFLFSISFISFSFEQIIC